MEQVRETSFQRQPSASFLWKLRLQIQLFYPNLTTEELEDGKATNYNVNK